MINLITNADDFAYFEGTSEGIVDLINKGRLMATSCMVTSHRWGNDAPALKPLFDKADIGLHLCLNKFPTITNFAKFDAARLKKIEDLIWILFSGKIKLAELEAEISAQIEAFIKYTGHNPAFIDGHHHVQQFPLVNLAVCNVIKRVDSKIYVRASAPKIENLLSLQMRAGGEIMRGLAKFYKIPINDAFIGLYDFKTQNIGQVFESQIKDLRGRNVIFMCHPSAGNAEQEKQDSIYKNRLAEYEFLNGEEILPLLAKYNIQIGRFLE